MYEQPKALRYIFEPNISDCCHLADESHHDPRTKGTGHEPSSGAELQKSF